MLPEPPSTAPNGVVSVRLGDIRHQNGGLFAALATIAKYFVPVVAIVAIEVGTKPGSDERKEAYALFKAVFEEHSYIPITANSARAFASTLAESFGVDTQLGFTFKYGGGSAPPPPASARPSEDYHFTLTCSICEQPFSSSVDSFDGEIVVVTDRTPGHDFDGVPWRVARRGHA